MADQSGTLVGSQTSYDAYGNLTSGSLGTSFGFAGQYRDSESGLYYMRARYYDPSSAQFISRDPLEMKTRKPFAYVADSPLNHLDPTGLAFPDGGEAGGMGPTVPIDILDEGSAPDAAPNYTDTAQFLYDELAAIQDANAPHPEGIDEGGRLPVAQTAEDPLPPGCDPETWTKEPASRDNNEIHWWDPEGGEWRWHAPDKWHPEGHWDYNPWSEWNSPWQHRPQ